MVTTLTSRRRQTWLLFWFKSRGRWNGCERSMGYWAIDIRMDMVDGGLRWTPTLPLAWVGGENGESPLGGRDALGVSSVCPQMTG